VAEVLFNERDERFYCKLVAQQRKPSPGRARVRSTTLVIHIVSMTGLVG
jgi:hypothetical protein